MILNDIVEEMSEKIYGKPYSNLNKKQKMKIDDAASEELFNIQAEDYAQGGRIGAQEGGLMDLGGIGSLEAGAPDIKYEGDMRMASHDANTRLLESLY